MNKFRRIWRAFCTGFWAAWKEVPPMKVGDLHVTVSCDTSQVTEELNAVIEQLKNIEQLKERALP